LLCTKCGNDDFADCNGFPAAPPDNLPDPSGAPDRALVYEALLRAPGQLRAATSAHLGHTSRSKKASNLQ
jgi:hypothetical protein